MSTTITSLALSIAARESVIAARAALVPLGRFAHSFAVREDDKGNVVKVPVFDRTSALEFNSSSNNYTTASSADVAGKNITLSHHRWNSARLLPDDDMETDVGRDWVQQTTVSKVEACAIAMANDALTSIVQGAGGSLTWSGGTSKAKVANARKQAIAAGINPMAATLLLDSDKFTDLIVELDASVYGTTSAIADGYVDRLLGFGRVAEVQNAPDGFSCAVVADDAFGIASRLPRVQNADLFDVSDISLPELGPWSFRVRATGTNNVDARFLGAEIIYGCAVLQPSKILVPGGGAGSSASQSGAA